MVFQILKAWTCPDVTTCQTLHWSRPLVKKFLPSKSSTWVSARTWQTAASGESQTIAKMWKCLTSPVAVGSQTLACFTSPCWEKSRNSIWDLVDKFRTTVSEIYATCPPRRTGNPLRTFACKTVRSCRTNRCVTSPSASQTFGRSTWAFASASQTPASSPCRGWPRFVTSTYVHVITSATLE